MTGNSMSPPMERSFWAPARLVGWLELRGRWGSEDREGQAGSGPALNTLPRIGQ